MLKVKSKILILSIVLAVAILNFLVFMQSNVSAVVVKPYPAETETNVLVEYVNGKIRIETTGGMAGYQYQYWLKENVSTDTENNQANNQYIWQLYRGYEVNNFVEVVHNSKYLDENGNYNIVSRVKDADDKIVDEQYAVFNYLDINIPLISGIKIDDYLIKEDFTVLTKDTATIINVLSYYSNQLTYSLYYGEADLFISSNLTGEFSVNTTNMAAGFHTYRVEIEDEDGVKDTCKVKVFIRDEIVSDNLPVIIDLIGTDNDNNGLTTFTMQLRYDSGKNIPSEVINDFNVSVTSGGITAEFVDAYNSANGVLNVEFSLTYNGYYGIYFTEGKVSRKDTKTIGDRIIRYYSGYSRDASVDLNCINGFEHQEKTTINITATGSINEVSSNNLMFAFYREDASNWVLIRDYRKISENGDKLTWTPQRQGLYRILVRIKDVNGGSYEYENSKIFNIIKENNRLTGEFTLNIYDLETNIESSITRLNKVYKIEAEYKGSEVEDVLYRFTVTNKNLGVVILSKFSTSPYLIYIANKTDEFIITAYAINRNGFGFMEVSTNTGNLIIADQYAPEIELNTENIEIQQFAEIDINTLISSVTDNKSVLENIELSYSATFENVELSGEDAPNALGVFIPKQIGQYTLKIIATDEAGNSSYKSVVLLSTDVIGVMTVYGTTGTGGNARPAVYELGTGYSDGDDILVTMRIKFNLDSGSPLSTSRIYLPYDTILLGSSAQLIPSINAINNTLTVDWTEITFVTKVKNGTGVNFRSNFPCTPGITGLHILFFDAGSTSNYMSVELLEIEKVLAVMGTTSSNKVPNVIKETEIPLDTLVQVTFKIRTVLVQPLGGYARLYVNYASGAGAGSAYSLTSLSDGWTEIKIDALISGQMIFRANYTSLNETGVHLLFFDAGYPFNYICLKDIQIEVK